MQKSRKATILDVAKLANVSQSTVTRALDKEKRMNMAPEILERVLAAVSALNYYPSPYAQQLKTRKSRVVSLPMIGGNIVPPIGTGQVTLQFNDAIAGAAAILEPVGYRLEPLFFTNAEEAARALPQKYAAGCFDAALFPHGELNPTIEELAARGCLVVVASTVDVPPPLEEFPNLVRCPLQQWRMNYIPMIEEVLRQGRTHLLFTFPIPAAAPEVFAARLSSGIKFEFLDIGNRSRARFIESIVEAVLENPYDAVVTPDEFFGWEVFRALHQSGVEVPERVTITGAGDVRHLFRPLPIILLGYAEKALLLREMCRSIVAELAKTKEGASFVVPPPLHGFRMRVQTMTAENFKAAARAELARERLQSVVESEILGLTD